MSWKVGPLGIRDDLDRLLTFYDFFYLEPVDVVVGGERVNRPTTPFFE